MMHTPLYEVGPHASALSALPIFDDVATRPGQKTNTYVAWNTVSRAYLSGMIMLPEKKSVTSERPSFNTERDKDKADRFIVDKDLALRLNMIDMCGYNMVRSGNYVCDLNGEIMDKDDSIDYSSLFTENAINSVKRAYSEECKSRTTSTSSSNFEKLSCDEVGSVKDDKAASGSMSNVTATTGVVYSPDILPTRVVAIFMGRADSELNSSPQFTQLFEMFNERLSGNSASATLGPMVNAPAFQDASAMTSLCKSIRSGVDGWRDIAPMVRAACVATALITQSYVMDPTLRQFMVLLDVKESRILSNMITSIRTFPEKTMTSKIMFCPLDTTVSILLRKKEQFTIGAEDIFPVTMLDVTWIVIPISHTMLGKRSLTAYIASFLSSRLWNGCVSHCIATKAYSSSDKQSKHFPTVYSRMPACINVSIDGPLNAIICLYEDTEKYGLGSVRMSGHTGAIPVYKTDVPIDSCVVDFEAAWRNYFITDDADLIAGDFCDAYNTICGTLATEDCCGSALSIVAELTAVNRPSYFCPGPVTNNEKAPLNTPNGLYTALPTTLGSGQRTIQSKGMFDGISLPLIKERMCGFNFGATSALLSVPASLIRIDHVTTKSTDPDTKAETLETVHGFWQKSTVDDANIQYRIPQSTSQSRLAIILKFINASENNYSFLNAQAMQAYIVMLSGALTFQCATALFKNNIDLRFYQGWSFTGNQELYQVTTLLHTYISGGFAKFVAPGRLSQYSTEWNYDKIKYFWGLNPTTSKDWSQYYPVSQLAAMQWMNKFGEMVAPVHVPTTMRVDTADTRIWVTDLSIPNNLQVIHAMATVDVFSYLPRANTLDFQRKERVAGYWYCNFGRISRYKVGDMPDQNQYSLQMPAFSSNVNILGLSGATVKWELSGVAHGFAENRYLTATLSTLIYPDPPTLSSFLAKAADYTVSPALMGMLGYITGGPVGAAVAAGSQIVSQAASDINDYRRDQKSQETISSIQNLVSEAKQMLPEVKSDMPVHLTSDQPHDEKNHREAEAVHSHDPSKVKNTGE